MPGRQPAPFDVENESSCSARRLFILEMRLRNVRVILRPIRELVQSIRKLLDGWQEIVCKATSVVSTSSFFYTHTLTWGSEIYKLEPTLSGVLCVYMIWLAREIYYFISIHSVKLFLRRGFRHEHVRALRKFLWQPTNHVQKYFRSANFVSRVPCMSTRSIFEFIRNFWAQVRFKSTRKASRILFVCFSFGMWIICRRPRIYFWLGEWILKGMARWEWF